MATEERPRPRSWLPYILLVVATVVIEWPVLTGKKQFFLRDIGTTHRPAREAFTAIGNASINPYASFGQSFRGNPNLLVAYPFPKDPRWLECQVLLHLAICFAGMVWLLRVLGTSADAAFFGAGTFAFSGYVLSASSSLNSITTIAWIPWILSGILLLSSGRWRWWAAGALLPLLALFSVAGEPVLIALTLILGTTILIARREWLALLLFAGVGLLAALATLPAHRATWIAAMDSSRVVMGYSFERATATSVHPARLLESILPYLFGDPSRIGPGAFWGYRVSQNTLPYIFSLHVSILAICMAVPLVLRSKREDRIAILVLAVCLLASMVGYLPGAEPVYESIPWLHVARFPVKFFLFALLALALLAARGYDRLLIDVDRKKPNRAAVAAGMICAGLFAIAGGIAHAGRSAIGSMLTRVWFDPTWRSDASLVLLPIVDSIPPRLLGIALLLGIAAWTASRPTRTRIVLLHAAFVADLFVLGNSLMPTVSAAQLEKPSPFVLAARSLPGRIYERAGKDLSAVFHGMGGIYTDNHASQFAIAQHRQAWALSGVRYGLKYAYDPAPDGSYTWRDEIIRKQLEGASWPERLVWLRSVGVAGIIASEKLPLAQVHGLQQEASVGAPVTLYAFKHPLPEVRRATHILWAPRPAAAFSLIRSPEFRASETIILEGLPRALMLMDGEVEVLEDGADEIAISTRAAGPGVVFIARSFTSAARAFANDKPVAVLPANGHLIGVLVPSGYVRLRVLLASGTT